MHQPRRQERNNYSRYAFREQPFPVTPNIRNKQKMHELRHEKGDEPHSERHHFYPWTRPPFCDTLGASNCLSAHKMSHGKPPNPHRSSLEMAQAVPASSADRTSRCRTMNHKRPPVPVLVQPRDP